MRLNEAISTRIKELCKEKDISINKLSLNSCITQSTVNDIIKCKHKSPNLMTIFHICNGLDISFKDFFDSEIFNLNNIIEDDKK